MSESDNAHPIVGLIVNPIAGMGGAVGLKGTDGPDILEQARARGAVPHAAERARRALAEMPGVTVLTVAGPMGSAAVDGLGVSVELLDAPVGDTTTADDTRRAAREMIDRGVALILFAGGDGTARDIADVAGLDTPILGIPCGVKMQSGVFAVSPEAAGRLAADLVTAGERRVGLRRVEIMDIDEAAVRQDRIAPRLHGYARAPHARNLLQAVKAGSAPGVGGAGVGAACAEIAANLPPDALTLIGPGATTKRVLSALGLEGTLLGVDAIRDGTLVGRDLSADQVATLAGDGPVRIIVGVTGGQGFVFGRGNQQIAPVMIRRAGPDGIVIVADEAKLSMLPGGRLLVDTGDPALDRDLAGYVRVRTGRGRSMMMRLA